MYAPDLQLTASQVLRTFHHDELYLFLGAAFTTVGLVSAAFAFIGRKFDAMLLWFAVFAILYGQRLWLQLDLLAMLVPPSEFFERLRASSNYLVPIPAVFYFDAAGFLGRYGRRIGVILSVVFLALFFGTFALGRSFTLLVINNVIVIGCLIALVVQSMQQKIVSREFVIVRRGLVVFVVFALFDNIAGALRLYPHVEPVGFAVFLAILGYVAATRNVRRDKELGEIQKELEIARRIQMAILPPAYPRSLHFQVAARYVPMTSVAGDFYDFVVAGEKQAGLLIADVSGHGVPAALIASMVKLAATSQRANGADPGALLSGMNAVLCGNTQNQFVTAAYVHLDAESGMMRYSAAAHPPMLLLRDGGVVEVLENGLMLAAFSFADYKTAVHSIEPGDRLILYTDGIIEAADAAGGEFGQDRLCSVVRESAAVSPEEAADRIVASVQRWSKAQKDDLTVLICDYAGN